jgi:glycosyltransferase involved in cell wall biosynthesis
MRVLFDAYWWAAGPMSNRSVLREFVSAWLFLYPDDQVAVAVPYAAIPLARLELEGTVTVTGTRLSPHGVSNIFELPVIAKRYRADVTITHNFSPLVGKSAVFVHDFIFKSNPEWFTLKERAYFALMPMSLPRATIVFTSTAAEAKRVQRYGRRESAPTAIGLGLGGDLEESEPSRPPLLRESANFVLSVGRLNIRKNLSKTIEAAIGTGSITESLPLVIVGEASGRGMRLSPTIQRAMEDGSVVFLGRVSNSELKWLYLNAHIFLFLTLDEGFGMPVLEALDMGTPMIVSDIEVFREILGNAATFVDPTDGPAISRALADALTKPRASARGNEILDYYTWNGAIQRMRAGIMTQLGVSDERKVTS